MPVKWWWAAEDLDDTTWPDTDRTCTVEVTENPVTAELLGPDGTPLRTWRERPTRFGYQLPGGAP